MALKVKQVPVWVGDIPDQPGGLNAVLGKLADAGANLQCVIARRQPEKGGTGVVFVSPITGRRQEGAARDAGLQATTNIVTLRIEGDDQPGLGRRVTQAIADMAVNLRGLTCATSGGKFTVYLALDTEADAIYTTDALKQLRVPSARPSRSPASRGTASRGKASRGDARGAAKPRKATSARKTAARRATGKASPKRPARKAAKRRS